MEAVKLTQLREPGRRVIGVDVKKIVAGMISRATMRRPGTAKVNPGGLSSAKVTRKKRNLKSG